MELQWNNIKTCVWDTCSERFSGDIYRIARKPCTSITQVMISKRDEWSGKMSAMKKNEQLHTTDEQTEKSHRQGQEGISWEHMWWNHVISKNKTLWFNVYNTKEPGGKENRGIQNMGIKNSPANIIVSDMRQVLKICENYVTEVYNQAKWPENLNLKRK